MRRMSAAQGIFSETDFGRVSSPTISRYQAGPAEPAGGPAADAGERPGDRGAAVPLPRGGRAAGPAAPAERQQIFVDRIIDALMVLERIGGRATASSTRRRPAGLTRARGPCWKRPHPGAFSRRRGQPASVRLKRRNGERHADGDDHQAPQGHRQLRMVELPRPGRVDALRSARGRLPTRAEIGSHWAIARGTASMPAIGTNVAGQEREREDHDEADALHRVGLSGRASRAGRRPR